MITIPLTQGQFTVIDDGDEALVKGYKWHASWNPCTKSFYATTKVQRGLGSRQTIRMHQLILDPQPGQTVDHRNHDTLDNTRTNLRIATRSENSLNRRYLQSTNKSGYVGVSWHNRDRRWLARIAIQGKMYHIGSFREPLAAARARDNWIRNNFSPEFFVFNFPEGAERGVEKRSEG